MILSVSNCINLKDVEYNKHLDISHGIVKSSKSRHHKGYIYFLIYTDTVLNQFKIKVGKTTNLKNRLANYVSSGTFYSLYCFYIFNEKSKKDLDLVLSETESHLIRTLKNQGLELEQKTKEHFSIKLTKESINKIQSLISKKESTDAMIYKVVDKKGSDLYKILQTETIYPNQQKAAKDIYKAMNNGSNIVLLDSQNNTQVGKTGAMAYLSILVKKAGINGEYPKIDILTGMNDNEWKEQTMDRMPVRCRKHENYDYGNEKIVHNVEHIKGIAKLQGLKSPPYLIMIDESHLGTGKNGVIASFFELELGVPLSCLKTNPKKVFDILKAKKIYLLLISATDFYSRHLIKTGIEIPSITLTPGKGYVSLKDLNNNNQIKDGIELFNKDSSQISIALESIINSNIKKRKYIILRAGQYSEKIKTLLLSKYEKKVEIIQYDSENYFVPDILSIMPSSLTIIILKDYWRAAKTITNKSHIVALIEKMNKNDQHIVSTVAQGLLGRCTGYNVPKDLIIYAPKKIVDQLIKNEFNPKQKLDTRTKMDTGKPKKQYNFITKVIKMPRSNPIAVFKKHLEKEHKNSKMQPLHSNNGIHTNSLKNWDKDFDPDFYKLSKKTQDLKKMESTSIKTELLYGKKDFLWYYESNGYYKIIIPIENHQKKSEMTGKNGYGD